MKGAGRSRAEQQTDGATGKPEQRGLCYSCACKRAYLGGQPVERRLCQDATSSPVCVTWGKMGTVTEAGVWAKSARARAHTHTHTHTFPTVAMTTTNFLHLLHAAPQSSTFPQFYIVNTYLGFHTFKTPSW